jgi:DNA-binding transcriptional MocR family regulator
MVSLLRSDVRLKDVVQVECPAGGLAVWIRATSDISVSAWSQAAARRGVRFAPGATHVERGDPPAFRAGFASFSAVELERVVSALGASLHDL